MPINISARGTGLTTAAVDYNTDRLKDDHEMQIRHFVDDRIWMNEEKFVPRQPREDNNRVHTHSGMLFPSINQSIDRSTDQSEVLIFHF